MNSCLTDTRPRTHRRRPEVGTLEEDCLGQKRAKDLGPKAARDLKHFGNSLDVWEKDFGIENYGS